MFVSHNLFFFFSSSCCLLVGCLPVVCRCGCSMLPRLCFLELWCVCRCECSPFLSLSLFLTPCRRVCVVFIVKPRSARGPLRLALVRYFRPAALESVHKHTEYGGLKTAL